MSLLDSLGQLTSAGQPAIALDTERCLHALNRSATCASCFEVCPAGAITPGKPPTLSAEQCQSCLACLAACPTGAYRANDAARSLVRSAAYLDGGTIELLCEKNPRPDRGVSADSTGVRVRGCLAGLGVGAHLALSALGFERIVVRADACAGCPWASLLPCIETQLAQAARLLDAWGRSDSLSCVTALGDGVERPVWNADNPPLSRRDLFRMLVRQGQLATADEIEGEPARPDRSPGRDRLRLLRAMSHLPLPDIEASLDLGELGFAFVSISEACTACGACARGCPTDALQFLTNEDTTAYALRFSARQCIGCDLCIGVCLPAAVSVDHAPAFWRVFSAETVIVRGGALTRCQRCGAPMAERAGTDVCDLCEYRRANPFGSVLPPGFARPQSGPEGKAS